MSKRLEGLPRHTSMHAAGVVISRTSIDEYVPLSRGADGTIVTQFTMTTLEELGLLKMDFLGLRTLTVIQDAVKMIEKNCGVKLDLAGQRRLQDLHEGMEADYPGGSHSRNLPVPSGSNGLYSEIFKGKE